MTRDDVVQWAGSVSLGRVEVSIVTGIWGGPTLVELSILVKDYNPTKVANFASIDCTVLAYLRYFQGQGLVFWR